VDDRLALAIVLAASARWDEADGVLARLVEAAPRRAEVRFVIAYAAVRRARWDVAVTAATEALVLRPHYPEARLVLAEALAGQGRDRDARRELAAFLREAPPEMADARARAEDFLRSNPTP
jgi:predicted Zn-dependent protease